jgi:hypothetical protein
MNDREDEQNTASTGPATIKSHKQVQKFVILSINFSATSYRKKVIDTDSKTCYWFAMTINRTNGADGPLKMLLNNCLYC